MYMINNLLTNPQLVQQVGFFLVRHTGNDKDFLATRVSYLMNLTGPSVNVQTACSTSLVAIHQAVQSLLNGECDMAIAGGSTIRQPHTAGYVYKEGEIVSPDGHCRSFDESSQGTVFGSGVGVVVLRRAVDAIADGDTIHAIIKGSAINNDGSMKVGYLAPSVDGQAKAVAEALAISGVDPETITYVEAHGTGTPVGDPIEIAALTQAFRAKTRKSGYCAIGSVKSNIGHLDTAAGVAGFIKTVLALKQQADPAEPVLRAAKPRMRIREQPVLRQHDAARVGLQRSCRAAPASAPSAPAARMRTSFSKRRLTPVPPMSRRGRISSWSSRRRRRRRSTPRPRISRGSCATHPDTSLADVAYTLQVGRQAFEHRRAVAALDTSEAVGSARERGSEARRDAAGRRDCTRRGIHVRRWRRPALDHGRALVRGGAGVPGGDRSLLCVHEDEARRRSRTTRLPAGRGCRRARHVSWSGRPSHFRLSSVRSSLSQSCSCRGV